MAKAKNIRKIAKLARDQPTVHHLLTMHQTGHTLDFEDALVQMVLALASQLRETQDMLLDTRHELPGPSTGGLCNTRPTNYGGHFGDGTDGSPKHPKYEDEPPTLDPGDLL